MEISVDFSSELKNQNVKKIIKNFKPRFIISINEEKNIVIKDVINEKKIIINEKNFLKSIKNILKVEP
jgi:hypothetical protein